MQKFFLSPDGLIFSSKLLAVLVCAYFLADTVSLFTDSILPDAPLVPAPRQARRKEERLDPAAYQNVLARNIFSSKNIIPDESKDILNGPARKTALPLNLIGTVVLEDELKSIATIEDKSMNLVFPVRVDETFADKAKVTKIEHLKVYFINKSSGQLEYVEILDDMPLNNVGVQTPAKSLRPSSTGVTQREDLHYEVDRTVIDKSLANLGEVLTQARAIPNFENGVQDGFKVIQIQPGSLYEQIGLKNGDILCGIDGESVNDIGKAAQLFNALKTANHLELCIKRSGKKAVYNYDIR